MTTETILTDAEIITIGHQARGIEPGENGYILPVTFARAIEQAVLAKLAEQEPVAWIDVEKLGVMHKDSRFNRVQWNTVLRVSKVEDDEIPLYTHPMPCVSPASDKTACVSEKVESDTQTNSQGILDSSKTIAKENLPPLPEPHCKHGGGIGYFDSYSKEQMIEYAKSAIDHHRTTKNHIADMRKKVPEGCALVPVEPTNDMVKALLDTVVTTSKGRVVNPKTTLTYALAAAPKYTGESK